MIKEYFVNYYQNNSQLEIRLKDQGVQVLARRSEPWRVTLVDTGLETLTAGRLLRVREYLGEEPFLLTYGDAVSDVDIGKLLAFHKKQGKAVTISTTQPEGRFGALQLDAAGSRVLGFKEKARGDQAFVNIGFMVMEPDIYQYLGDGRRRRGRWLPTGMKGSGRPWTTSMTGNIWRSCGRPGRRPGGYRRQESCRAQGKCLGRVYLKKLRGAGKTPWRQNRKKGN